MEMVLASGQQMRGKENKGNLLQFLILTILLFLSAHPGSGYWTPVRRMVVSNLGCLHPGVCAG